MALLVVLVTELVTVAFAFPRSTTFVLILGVGDPRAPVAEKESKKTEGSWTCFTSIYSMIRVSL